MCLYFELVYVYLLCRLCQEKQQSHFGQGQENSIQEWNWKRNKDVSSTLKFRKYQRGSLVSKYIL